MNTKIKFTITDKAKHMVELLINEGWEFDLTYTEPMSEEYEEARGKGVLAWEADFTRRREDGLWDNHEFGVHPTSPSEAITQAYKNIRKGKRI